ncbi:MAG: hypothetical protein GY944_15105 [bacterium]|nr:hypothetical protein [bacterium]
MNLRRCLRAIALGFALATFALPFGEAPQASEPDTSAAEQVSEEDDCPPCQQSDETESGREDEAEEPEEDEGPVCHGILTCTFWGVGQVLAVPFRLLRGALDILI